MTPELRYCAKVLKRKLAATFVDSAFGAPTVESLWTLGFDHMHEVSFRGPSPDYHDPTDVRLCGVR
jgi:hypothetical protein